MSLHHIAQHLKDQGRGPDDMLVHMTSGEVKALQGLAQAHGGSLSINPKTGLPEAGILSTVLPMALGAVAVATGQLELLPYIAAGVGVADYAITGSLTQGLMAGLGTWSGGSLMGAAEGIGAASIEEAGKQSVNASINASLEAGGNEAIKVAGQQAADAAIKQGADQAAQQAARQAAEEAAKGRIIDEASQQVTKEGLQQATQYGSSMSKIGQGLSNAGNTGIFDSAANAGKFAMDNKFALAGTALPFATSALGMFDNKSVGPTAATQQKNPFGLKTIPRDANGNPIFNASIPEQPNPAYKTVYPNYVANPYSPVGAADGGLMADKTGQLDGVAFSQQDGQTYDNGGMTNPVSFASGGIPSYAGKDYGSIIKGYDDMQQGLETATRRPLLQTPTPEVGIYVPESETKGMDSLDAAMHYLNKNYAALPKGASAIKKQGSLGAISHTPAAQAAQEAAAAQKAKESIAKNSDTKEAKEGGLMRFDAGGVTTSTQTNSQPNPGLPQVGNLPDLVYQVMSQGSSTAAPQAMQPQQANQPPSAGLPQMNGVYQPQYIDYAANPYNPQAAQQYAPPAAAPMAMSGGYQIDPLRMQGSPAYNAEQARLAAEKAAQEAEQNRIAAANQTNNYDYASGAKAGGLMGYATGGHLGGYSDGGRLLRGPGDGVSDSIPATIGGKQPARLAEGEFVIPARIVSELGNGSTDAGAKRLYAMMDRIKAKRTKTKNIAADTKAYKYLPA